MAALDGGEAPASSRGVLRVPAWGLALVRSRLSGPTPGRCSLRIVSMKSVIFQSFRWNFVGFHIVDFDTL